MALPTLTKTWQFNVNNALASFGTAALDNKNLLLQQKNALMGFGTLPATMFYSCNSVTAGTAGDGVDRLATAANFVANNAGSAHSWYVLKFPGIGSNFQFLLDYNNNAAAGNAGQISYSPSAGFTGGSTTAAPTATDQVGPINSGSGLTGITTDLAQRWSVMQSTDGQCILIFSFAAGTPRTFGVFQKGANPTGGTPGATNSGFGHWTNQATSALGGFALQNAISATTVLSYETPAMLSIASEVSGLWDLFPVGQTCQATVGARGRLFTLQDIWVASPSLAIGDTAPLTGSPSAQFACVQANASQTIWVPWNNGAINLS